jgi:hypothetical protein
VHSTLRGLLAALLLAAGLSFAVASPAAAEPGEGALLSVADGRSGKSYLYRADRNNYYVVVCDVKADGNHARGWFQTSSNSNGPFTIASPITAVHTGNGTCARGPNVTVFTGKYINLWVGTYQGSGTTQLASDMSWTGSGTGGLYRVP